MPRSEPPAERPADRPSPAPPPWRRGVVEALPLIAGYLPFGLVLGATIAASDVPDLIGWASSPLVFAGAAQLALIDLLDSGAATIVVIATAAVINLRHVMYSGALAPWFRDAPTWWQFTAPHLMADPVYTLAAVRFPELPHEPARRSYYAGLGLTLFLGWCGMTAAGIVVGASLPRGVDLSVAVPLVFLALLIPTVTDRPSLAAAVAGGAVTIAADGLPFHLGLLVGALSGVAVGLGVDRAVGARPAAEGPP